MKDSDLSKWLEQEYDPSRESGEPDLDAVIEMTDRFFIEEMDEDKVFASIQSKIESNRQKSKIAPLRWMLAAAASVIGILIAFNLFFDAHKISTTHGQIVNHILPDRSEVILNSQSEISYADDYENNRLIQLDGEAFFRVEKGEQFRVKTELGTVRVLGTSFNIFARDDVFVVACKTGRVAVSTGVDSIFLTAGKRTRLVDSQLVVEDVKTSSLDAWTIEGESFFESTPLSEILLSLSSQYKVTIKPYNSGYKKLRFTGSYVHDDLEKALKMILLPMDIDYILGPDNILEIK